jgi:hypothetical protein
MQHQVHTLLYLSAESYAEGYFERFLRWCLSRSVDRDQDVSDPWFLKPDTQHLIANTAISKWYDYEFGKLEAKFIEIVNPQHGLIDFAAARQIYNSLTNEMLKKFPQTLIDSARNLNINAN